VPGIVGRVPGIVKNSGKSEEECWEWCRIGAGLTHAKNAIANNIFT